MHFTDDSLLPENQAPLIICAAPYGPEAAAGLPSGYSYLVGGSGPEGAGLLQYRS